MERKMDEADLLELSCIPFPLADRLQCLRRRKHSSTISRVFSSYRQVAGVSMIRWRAVYGRLMGRTVRVAVTKAALERFHSSRWVYRRSVEERGQRYR
jgi:hypothetical protein